MRYFVFGAYNKRRPHEGLFYVIREKLIKNTCMVLYFILYLYYDFKRESEKVQNNWGTNPSPNTVGTRRS